MAEQARAAFVTRQQVLRGSPADPPLYGITKQELFHHHEGGDQGISPLAVTDDAVDTAWQDKIRMPKQDDYQGNMCLGSRYTWMAGMMKKCKDMFGPQSYWEHRRRPFCEQAFQQCQPYYAQCCTQPEGAISLGAYCEIRSHQKHLGEDPACAVEKEIEIIQNAIAKIPDMANRILLSKPRVRPEEHEAWQYRTGDLISTVADQSYHSRSEDSSNNDDNEANDDAQSKDTKGIHDKEQKDAGAQDSEKKQADASTPAEVSTKTPGTVAKDGADSEATTLKGPVDADAVAALAAGMEAGAASLLQQKTGRDPEEGAVDSSSSSSPDVTARPPEQWQQIFSAPPREVHCDELSRVLSEMNGALDRITTWKAVNAGNKYDPESLSNLDPELMALVGDLVTAGRMLKQRANACQSTPMQERKEDLAEQHFLQLETGADQGIVLDEVSRKNWDLVETDVQRLTSRMDAYMGFVGFMNFHVSSIESSVHPHGDKWWRYRYEETLVEMLFHIPVFAALICLQWLLNHMGEGLHATAVPAAPSSRSKLCSLKFYGHLNASCTHNAMALAIIMLMLWSIYASTPLFDWFASAARLSWEACLDSMEGHCIFESVPFSGRAYFKMWIGVVMNVLGACLFYSLCVWEFIRSSTHFLEKLKMSEQPLRGNRPEALSYEVEQYLAFQEIFCTCISKMEKSERLKECAKAVGLDLDKTLLQRDLKKVKFHRYLVLSLDEASRDFTLWSSTLLVTLITCCSIVSFVAGWKKMSFAWFLPAFLVLLFILLAVAYVLKRALWACTIAETSEASMPWLSAKGWIAAVQTVLFMLCYCFARLVFSRSIWTEYPALAVCLFVGFGFFIVLTKICISDLMMRMVCVLSLPPNASTDVVEQYLEQMADIPGDAKAPDYKPVM